MNEILDTVAPIAAAVAITIFALPSYIGVFKQRGLAKGLAIIATLGVFCLVILGLSAQLGLPFGKFSFNENLGYKIFGIVPWTIAFAYPPMLLAGYWLSGKISQSGFLRILLSAVFALLLSAAVDPAVAKLTLWQWETTGPYFGLPIMNFVSWFAIWLAGAYLLDKLWGEENAMRSIAYSGFCILWFWAGVNLGLKQWIPAAIGLVIGVVLIVMMILERRQEKRK